MAANDAFKPLNPNRPSPVLKDTVRMMTPDGEAMASIIDLPGAGSVRVRIHSGPGQGQFKTFPVRAVKKDAKGQWVIDDSRASGSKSPW